MGGLNKILVIGNVGTDPEMRYTPNGHPVTSFRLATSRTYTTSEGERREETEWFTVTAWRQLAEQVNQYVIKGRRVYAEGRLKSDTWVGQDGQNRFKNEIVAERVLYLDRSPQAGPEGGFEGDSPADSQGGTPTGSQGGAPTGPEGDAEDLPW